MRLFLSLSRISLHECERDRRTQSELGPRAISFEATRLRTIMPRYRRGTSVYPRNEGLTLQ